MVPPAFVICMNANLGSVTSMLINFRVLGQLSGMLLLRRVGSGKITKDATLLRITTTNIVNSLRKKQEAGKRRRKSTSVQCFNSFFCIKSYVFGTLKSQRARSLDLFLKVIEKQ